MTSPVELIAQRDSVEHWLSHAFQTHPSSLTTGIAPLIAQTLLENPYYDLPTLTAYLVHRGATPSPFDRPQAFATIAEGDHVWGELSELYNYAPRTRGTYLLHRLPWFSSDDFLEWYEGVNPCVSLLLPTGSLRVSGDPPVWVRDELLRIGKTFLWDGLRSRHLRDSNPADLTGQVEITYNVRLRPSLLRQRNMYRPPATFDLS